MNTQSETLQEILNSRKKFHLFSGSQLSSPSFKLSLKALIDRSEFFSLCLHQETSFFVLNLFQFRNILFTFGCKFSDLALVFLLLTRALISNAFFFRRFELNILWHFVIKISGYRYSKALIFTYVFHFFQFFFRVNIWILDTNWRFEEGFPCFS